MPAHKSAKKSFEEFYTILISATQFETFQTGTVELSYTDPDQFLKHLIG